MKVPSYWTKKPNMCWPLGSNNEVADVWEHSLTDLRVLMSQSAMDDGSVWYHLSVSRPDRLPSWVELCKVKDEFLGEQAEAIHLIPKKKDHVNIHNFCIHLWSPISVEWKFPNLYKLIMEKPVN